MNTFQFIETAQWLVSIVNESAVKDLVDPRFAETLLRGDVKDPSDFIARVFEATHELATLRPRIIANQNAVEIVKAFGLDSLMDPKFPTGVAKSLSIAAAEQRAGPGTGHAIYEILSPISATWRRFVSCIQPIDHLLIPREISVGEPSIEILTLEIRKPGNSKPNAEVMASILTNIDRIYRSVTDALQKESVPPLELVFLTSGSDVRFDLKGVGDAVKYVKELFIEGWEKIRHRKSDDFRQNTKAALEGLHTLDVLSAHRALDPETKQRISHHIVDSMLELFKAGALPRDIQPVEIVSNDQLMSGIQQKLLPAPPPTLKQTPARKAPKPRAR
jgi:hypothetical protein